MRRQAAEQAEAKITAIKTFERSLLLARGKASSCQSASPKKRKISTTFEKQAEAASAPTEKDARNKEKSRERSRRWRIKKKAEKEKEKEKAQAELKGNNQASTETDSSQTTASQASMHTAPQRQQDSSPDKAQTALAANKLEQATAVEMIQAATRRLVQLRTEQHQLEGDVAGARIEEAARLFLSLVPAEVGVAKVKANIDKTDETDKEQEPPLRPDRDEMSSAIVKASAHPLHPLARAPTAIRQRPAEQTGTDDATDADGLSVRPLQYATPASFADDSRQDACGTVASTVVGSDESQANSLSLLSGQTSAASQESLAQSAQRCARRSASATSSPFYPTSAAMYCSRQ